MCSEKEILCLPELREPTALWEPPVKRLLPSRPSTDSGPAAPAPPAGPSPPFRGGKCEEACTPRTPASLVSPRHPGPAATHTLKAAPVRHQEAVTEPSLAPRRVGPPTESRTDPEAPGSLSTFLSRSLGGLSQQGPCVPPGVAAQVRPGWRAAPGSTTLSIFPSLVWCENTGV